MAFGKADTGLIQADKASYGPDEMLGLAAGAGAVAKGALDNSMKQMEGAAKAKRETKNKFAGAYAKGLNDNSGFANPAAQQWLTGEINRDSELYASQAGDVVSQNQTITDSQSYSNQLYSGEGKIKAFREFHKGRQTRALNSDETDNHFQDQLGAGNYELRRNSEGVVEWGVKNPAGYEGEKEDGGYTWFTEANLPLGDEYNNEGGAYVLNIFNTEVNKRTDGHEGVSPDFKNKYKKQFTEMNMNHFDLKTLIAQDPEGDNIDGNDFYTAFVNGKLPDEYYEGVNGKMLTEEEWTERTNANRDPNATTTFQDFQMGTYEEYKKEQMQAQKMDPKTLKSWLNGENMRGTKDYNNLSNRSEWIIDKFSKYMGEITTEGYNIKQKEELSKQNRYFQDVGADGAFMGKGGKAPATPEIMLEKKMEVYKDLKFETVLGENYDVDTLDFNKLVGANNDMNKGVLAENIESSYANHIKNDELEVDVDDNVLTLTTKEGGKVTFDFVNDPQTNQPRTKESQKLLMEKLKKHLNTLEAIPLEFEALGNNANEWNMATGFDLVKMQTQNNNGANIEGANIDETNTETYTPNPLQIGGSGRF